ncbi:MAG: MFS transporter [Anaerolineales bacterium]
MRLWRNPTGQTCMDDRTDIHRVIKISTIEGMFWQVYATLAAPGSVFLTKFAVMLGATPLQFGVLSAIGQVSQVFQPLGAAITRTMTSRKRMVVALISWGRAVAFLYGLLPFLLPSQMAMWAFLGLFLVATSLQAIGGNIWVGWISDLIPLEKRGRFFAVRSQYLMLVGLVTGYVFSAFLDPFDAERTGFARAVAAALGNAPWLSPAHLPHAFVAVMAIAAAVGLVGARILMLQPERPKAVEQERFRDAVADSFRDSNFCKLLLYGSWWMLAVGIGGPFWGAFMIKKLGMSLISIQVYGMIQTLAALVSLRPWGSFIDRFGNKAAMRIAIVMGGINPLVWLFATPANHGFLYIEAATSGVMWAGAGVVASNFVLSIAPEGRRQMYSGIFGAVSGFAMMLTLLASGAFLPPKLVLLGLHLEPEQVLFGLGGLMRWSAQIPLSWVHEPGGASVRAALREGRRAAGAWVARVRRAARRGP